MTCPYDAQIDDYIDGTLGRDDAAAFDAHLPGCEQCAAAVADLRAIRTTARVLERHAVPPQVWTRIAEAIAAEPPRRTASAWLPARGWQLAIAASIMIVLGAGAWLSWRQVTPPAATVAVAPAAAELPEETNAELIESVETRLQLAEQNYADTISGLDAIRKAEAGALDPETAEVLQVNLTVIDDAIGESRAALQSEPSNSIAQESLFDALQSKVSLLQDTIALINEMRKGDPDGTARIASELNP
jgi:hypothetical protein